MQVTNRLSVLFTFSLRLLALLLGAISAAPWQAASASDLVLEATFTTSISNGWETVERWRDTKTAFVQEAFPSDGRGDQNGQRVTFFGGDATPHSSRFLLYYAPGWDTNANVTPVLLVHGATQNADQAWANPNEAGAYACGQEVCPQTGLMQALSNEGFKVFAISFPHSNGDGFFWTQQIADAIEIIKSRTGEAAVDVVSWSKGAFNARMYVSSLKEPWGTAYRGDVERLIMIGGPNNGFDWSFRHGWFGSLSVYPQCGGATNGPAVHDWMLCFGIWWNGPEWTYSSSFFPGSSQMLKRWDSVYSLPILEQDWWTTYYGGWGFFTHAEGIEAFLGASVVDELRNAGIPADVRTHNLCGNRNDIPFLHNEHTGPSDGVIFIASCDDSTGIADDGGSAVVAVNHLQLGWASVPVVQIKSWLAAP